MMIKTNYDGKGTELNMDFVKRIIYFSLFFLGGDFANMQVAGKNCHIQSH